MGMFDTIHATGHAIVPNGSYQTKDLGCDLDRYELREDGTLWKTGTLEGRVEPVKVEATDAIRLYSTCGGAWILMYVRGAMIYAGRE